MDNEKGFLEVLAENPHDYATRLVYADWLEENGQCEEADRQRAWEGAYAWLEALCEEHSDPYDDGKPSTSPRTLIERGLESYAQVYDDDNPLSLDYLGFHCGSDMGVQEALNRSLTRREFWANWSILTGKRVPEEDTDAGYFSCSC